MRVISRHGYIGSIIVFARVDAIFKIRIIPYPKIIIANRQIVYNRLAIKAEDNPGFSLCKYTKQFFDFRICSSLKDRYCVPLNIAERLCQVDDAVSLLPKARLCDLLKPPFNGTHWASEQTTKDQYDAKDKYQQHR